jgi:hypothetical protein
MSAKSEAEIKTADAIAPPSFVELPVLLARMQQARRAPDGFLGCEAGHLPERRIDVYDDPLAVGDDASATCSTARNRLALLVRELGIHWFPPARASIANGMARATPVPTDFHANLFKLGPELAWIAEPLRHFTQFVNALW